MRNAAFLGVGIVLILIQAQVYRLLGPIGLHGATPQLVLPLIVFLGVHEPSMARGALLAFGLGYALDVLGSAPMFLLTFVSVAIWWLSRIAGVRLTAQTVLTRMSLALAFSIVESAIVLILLAVFGNDTRRPLEIATVVLPQAVSTSICAPLVFQLAQRLHQSSAPVHASAESAVR